MADVQVRDLRRCQPGLALEVAARLDRDRQRVVDAMRLVIKARGQGWSGPAADAAAATRADTVGRLAEVAMRLASTAAVVRELGERLGSCRALLHFAESVATTRGGWTDEDGNVVVPQRVPSGDPTVDAHVRRLDDVMRVEVARILAEARRLASETDRDVQRRLDEASRRLPTGGLLAPLALVPPPVVQTGDRGDRAFATAAWWRGLSRDERALVSATHPEWVGPRDGIPAQDRHLANLVLLGRARAEVAQEIRQAGALGRRTHPLAFERAEAIKAIDDVLGQHDGVTRHLLLVDVSGPVVRAVTTVGDVDKAGHVTTFVGGLTTNPASDLGRYDKRFGAMRTQAWTKTRGAGEDADVAIAIWMGYPAPQLRDGLIGPRAVVRDDVARDYADELAAFVNGIDASRDVPPHQALWAHSYGTLLTGHALLQSVYVDDVAFFGSPGTPIRSLAEAGLRPGSLNVLSSPSDPVGHSGWFTGDPSEIPGASILSTSGAIKPGSLNPFAPAVLLGPSWGHSEYLLSGTTSEYNLTSIAAGRPDLKIGGSGR